MACLLSAPSYAPSNKSTNSATSLSQFKNCKPHKKTQILVSPRTMITEINLQPSSSRLLNQTTDIQSQSFEDSFFQMSEGTAPQSRNHKMRSPRLERDGIVTSFVKVKHARSQYGSRSPSYPSPCNNSLVKRSQITLPRQSTKKNFEQDQRDPDHLLLQKLVNI